MHRTVRKVARSFIAVAGIAACDLATFGFDDDGSADSVVGPASSSGGAPWDRAVPSDAGAPWVTAEVGPEGGTLRVDGVVLEIPAGALLEPRTLTLKLTPGPTVDVEPDTVFERPVLVRLSPDVWPPDTDGYVVSEMGDSWLRVADLIAKDGEATFEVTSFSDKKVLRATPALACNDSWLPGDAWPTWREQAASGMPDPKMRAVARDRDSGCLGAYVETKPTPIGKDPVTYCKKGCCSVDAKACNTSNRDHCSTDRNCSFHERSADEATSMSVSTMAALSNARLLVLQASDNLYDLNVNGAFDSSGRIHGGNSLHYYGAALDIGLLRVKEGEVGKVWEAAVLGRIGPMLAQAGFSWVFYEYDHFHASIPAPECGVTRGASALSPPICHGPNACLPSGIACFPGTTCCEHACVADEKLKTDADRCGPTCTKCEARARCISSATLERTEAKCVDGVCAAPVTKQCPPNAQCVETSEGASCIAECGAPSQPCCEGGGCNAGAQCSNGTCEACGAPGQPCCAGTCHAGAQCSSGTCAACGAPGQPCCAGACHAGAQCNSGTCVACGARGQPCCAGGTCDAGAQCSSGTCTACGARGQACCGGVCTGGNACGCDSLCHETGYCGGIGQPCCCGACTAPSSACDAINGTCVYNGPFVSIAGGSVTSTHTWTVTVNGQLRCDLTIPPNGSATCHLDGGPSGSATLTISRTSAGGTTCPSIALGGGAVFAAGQSFPGCFGSVGTLRLTNSAGIVLP